MFIINSIVGFSILESVVDIELAQSMTKIVKDIY